MKKISIHMIKPGRTVTQNGMVEAYCQIMYFTGNATNIKKDVNCKKCLGLNEKDARKDRGENGIREEELF